ncbi:Zinc-binding GTPase, partial [Frankliniella fusca]
MSVWRYSYNFHDNNSCMWTFEATSAVYTFNLLQNLSLSIIERFPSVLSISWRIVPDFVELKLCPLITVTYSTSRKSILSEPNTWRNHKIMFTIKLTVGWVFSPKLSVIKL